jgi:(2R)-ethylmalonyl-CoA mutase
MNVCSYHLQEAGATPVQELAFALANAVAMLDSVKARGRCRTRISPRRWGGFRSSSIPACASSPRCARCAPLSICGMRSQHRYGIEDPKYRRFRYGVQVNSLGLTEQQPENNVYRILIEMLAVVLSKDARARAVQLPAWNEALGLPRPWDQQWSLRMQQMWPMRPTFWNMPTSSRLQVMDAKVEAN